MQMNKPIVSEQSDMFPARGHVHGNIAGVQAFRALLEHTVMDDADPAVAILNQLDEAFTAIHEPHASTRRKSAAVKLLDLVAQSLAHRAAQTDCGAWLDGEMLTAQRHRKTVLRLESLQNARNTRSELRFQSMQARAAADQRQ
jgi:hypothetical protein